MVMVDVGDGGMVDGGDGGIDDAPLVLAAFCQCGWRPCSLLIAATAALNLIV